MGTNEANNPKGDKLPETDYYHDQGTTGVHVPELVDTSGFDMGEIVWDGKDHTKKGPVTKYDRDLIDSIPVRVVDVAEKVKRVRHIVLTVAIPADSCVSILSKDPTRIFAKVIETGGTSQGFLLNEMINNATIGFPVVNLPDKLESEEELFVYNSDTVNSITIRVYAEYVRSDASREERFYGSVLDGKRR